MNPCRWIRRGGPLTTSGRGDWQDGIDGSRSLRRYVHDFGREAVCASGADPTLIDTHELLSDLHVRRASGGLIIGWNADREGLVASSGRRWRDLQERDVAQERVAALLRIRNGTPLAVRRGFDKDVEMGRGRQHIE